MSFIFDRRVSDSPLIDTIWRTHSESAGSFISAAAAHSGIVIWRYEGKMGVTVRGPETKATPADYPEDAEFLGINFKLGTFMPHMPAKMVMDRQDITLPEAASRSFWLHGSAWQFPDFENADTFIDRLVRENLLTSEPVVAATLQGHQPDLSLRAIQRRFIHSTGLTYKTIQQIDRAHRAVSLLQQGTPILDTAYEVGYFDQSHLTNALRHFVGQTPAQILRPEMSLWVSLLASQ